MAEQLETVSKTVDRVNGLPNGGLYVVFTDSTSTLLPKETSGRVNVGDELTVYLRGGDIVGDVIARVDLADGAPVVLEDVVRNHVEGLHRRERGWVVT